MNILFCSAGRRVQLIKDFKESMGKDSKIIATDMSYMAPAIYVADKFYIVPSIEDETYISTIIDICKKEQVNVITTVIDPEIEVLSHYRDTFKNNGIEVLAPYEETAKLCFDKYEMFKFLLENDIRTPLTYGCLKDSLAAIQQGIISYPVFVKPRTGSGSVGAKMIYDENELKDAFDRDDSLIAQQLMKGIDIDADVYVDVISEKPVSIFSKKKYSMTIGGANKTVSFKDEKLNDFIKVILEKFRFHGPIDMDFFNVDGQYYLNEINPRFGGAYIHAYGCGVDFFRLIEKNLKGEENKENFMDYEEDIAMLMYDAVIIQKMNGSSSACVK